MLVKIVLFPARVGEGNVIESNDWWWKPADVLKVESVQIIELSTAEMKTEHTYRKGFGVSTFSMSPAASILSMIFCLDFA